MNLLKKYFICFLLNKFPLKPLVCELCLSPEKSQVLLQFRTGPVQKAAKKSTPQENTPHRLNVCQTEGGAHFDLNKAKQSQLKKSKNLFPAFILLSSSPNPINCIRDSGLKHFSKERKHKALHVCKLCIIHLKHKCCVT